MSAKNTPKVSIGLPVYNGEHFLEEAIQSILAQTFKDFEFVISDNASTDGTEEICRVYAAQDQRVRYFRNEKNLGINTNFNQVFRLSSGEYFKWAAHDDLCDPDFLFRCVTELDRDRSLVLCYARTITIDTNGTPRKKWNARPEFGSEMVHRRFREALMPAEPFPLAGLIRADILRKTPLMGTYPAADLVLLSELSLYGRFYEIPDFLFLHREHPQRSVRAHDWRNPHTDVTWWDPFKAGKIIFPQWRLFGGHVSAINRAPISWPERGKCYLEVIHWLRCHRQTMLRDVGIAVGRLSGMGPLLMRGYEYYVRSRWVNRTKGAVRDLESIVPVEDMVILVDEAKLDTEFFVRWRTIPFLEREGNYWGPPGDDGTAVSELQRLRRSGANFIAFAWPAFWWLEYYSELHAHLRSEFRCLLQNHRLVVYDLRS